MGMIRWEWEGNGNKKVVPAHLYSGGVACSFETWLWQFRPIRTCSRLSAATPQVRPQRRSSSGVSTSSATIMLRTLMQLCIGCACQGRLSSGCYGVSSSAWSCSAVPKSVGSCRWPALPSTISFVVNTPTACFTIPSMSSFVAGRCIRRLELCLLLYPSSVNDSSHSSYKSFLTYYYDSRHVIRLRGLTKSDCYC